MGLTTILETASLSWSASTEALSAAPGSLPPATSEARDAYSRRLGLEDARASRQNAVVSNGRPDVITNAKSEARDHLANERTFLAWLRTSLGLVGLGILLTKFELGLGAPRVTAGIGTVLFASLSLVYATFRYYRVNRLLLEGKYPVARRGPLVVASVALVLTLGALAWLLMSLPHG